MLKISPSDFGDAEVLAKLGRETFLEPHSESAPAADLEKYVSMSFSLSRMQEELKDPCNIFHIVRWNDEVAGYSKIVPNSPNPKISSKNVTKLERLYIKKEYYGQRVGLSLFQYNLELAKKQGQQGFWLTVWPGNSRAIEFYRKQGFSIIGETYFKISETHSNPNHWMYVAFKCSPICDCERVDPDRIKLRLRTTCRSSQRVSSYLCSSPLWPRSAFRRKWEQGSI